jgi:hypothetical protein
MADSRQERGPQDRSRINVNEDYELRYWSKEFGVSADQLIDAVKRVGVSADKVREHLKH